MCFDKEISRLSARTFADGAPLRVVDGGRDADSVDRNTVLEGARLGRNGEEPHAGPVRKFSTSVIIDKPSGRRFVPIRRGRYLSVIQAGNWRRAIFARALLRWCEAEERLKLDQVAG